MELIWGKREAVYFCRAIWTTQITLNRLMKFVFWRSGFEVGKTHCTFACRRE
jgi:hypothetical protein